MVGQGKAIAIAYNILGVALTALTHNSIEGFSYLVNLLLLLFVLFFFYCFCILEEESSAQIGNFNLNFNFRDHLALVNE